MKAIWRWLVGGSFVSWTDQVQVLKTDRPLALPAIKPLKAERAKKPKRARVAAFRRGNG